MTISPMGNQDSCFDEACAKTSTRLFDPIVTSLLLLGLILTGATLRRICADKPVPPIPQAFAAIDPNTAPWWELMVLPGVGETTARKIVDYRDAHSGEGIVFGQPADLEPVPGIGPKTIQRISPFLRFGE